LKTLNKTTPHESNELLFNATSPASKALAEDINHHISYSDDIPSALLLDSVSGVLDLNVLSPMQQDEEHQYLSMDDAFKMISQATPPPPSLHNLDPPSPEEVEAAVADIISDDTVPILTDFNDLDLMEFQMDIEDDSCGHHQQQQQQQQPLQQNSLQSTFNNDSDQVIYNKVNGNHQSNSNNNNGLLVNGGCRRDMNPSLQPSLNDIIQQQQQQQQHQQQQQNGFIYNNNLHDSYVDTPMDFENLLANFEIPSLANSGLDNIGNSSCNNHLPTSYDILGSPLSQTTTTSINYHHHQNHYLNHHSPHHDNILDLFNEDYRMTLSDPMSCEVDNLLCNI
jgi:hypothetical protein